MFVLKGLKPHQIKPEHTKRAFFSANRFARLISSHLMEFV